MPDGPPYSHGTATGLFTSHLPWVPHELGLWLRAARLAKGLPHKVFSPVASRESTSSAAPFTRNLTLRPAKANP